MSNKMKIVTNKEIIVDIHTFMHLFQHNIRNSLKNLWNIFLIASTPMIFHNSVLESDFSLENTETITYIDLEERTMKKEPITREGSAKDCFL